MITNVLPWLKDKLLNNCFCIVNLLHIKPLIIQNKVLESMTIKANQDEKYLHPKEVLITDYFSGNCAF